MADDRRAHTWFAWVHPRADREQARHAAIEFSTLASKGGITREAVESAIGAGLVIDHLIMSIN